jgi:hypothetical protein
VAFTTNISPLAPKMVFPLVGVWAIAIGVGGFSLLRYANTPGRLAAPPADWPANVPLRQTQGKQTLVLFLHPECPCSAATVGELARIMVWKQSIEAFALFLAPGNAPEWRASALYDNTRRIPGVRIVSDPEGWIGRRFGARTSGQALLYDQCGKLQFNGGITISRGHNGDNDGVDSIVALVRGVKPKARTTPVFGCALYGDE